MSSLNVTVILTPKQAREYRLQVSDLTSASEQPEINRSRYARTCDLVNATRKPQSDLDVLDFYSRRYTGLPYAQPTTPYIALEAVKRERNAAKLAQIMAV